MVVIVCGECDDEGQGKCCGSECDDGHVEGCVGGLHDAMPDAEEECDCEYGVCCCLCDDDAEEFAEYKEGPGDGFGYDGENGFVLYFFGEDACGDEGSQCGAEYVDGAQSAGDHEDVIVFEGVACQCGVDDQGEDANEYDDHVDRLPDALCEGVTCDSEELLYHGSINVC